MQKLLCQRFDVAPSYVGTTDRLGISRDVLSGGWPLNGLRHPPGAHSCGWYIWSGKVLSQDPDFFVPVHATHLFESRPEVSQYLGLPPGWRFLIAPNYEDVWRDDSLLNI